MWSRNLFLNDYKDRLIEKAKYNDELGLWNGKMGIAISLLHLSRITKNNDLENVANELLNAVFKNLSYQMPFTFADGLLGIGCGFEYIIRKGFVEGDSDEILSEIDQIANNIINSRSIKSLDIEKGLCGVGYYLYYRLEKKSNNDESFITLNLKEHLIYLIDWFEELLIKTKTEQDYINSYFLLCRLQKLNVFNHKVEKLITLCLQKIVDLNCHIRDNYELLGINSLKVLKPWI